MRNLRNLVSVIIMFIYFMAPIFMATVPSDYSYKTLYERQLLENKLLCNEIQDKEAQLCYLQVNSKQDKAKTIKKVSSVKESRAPIGLLRLEGNYIGNFTWLYLKKDYFYIDPQLAIVLSKYTGPNANVTSLHRPHSGRSAHCKARAVDIKFDEQGKQMAEWLVTNDGKKWIEDNNVTVYFEKIRDKKYTSGDFKSFYLNNPKATGPHIHIEI